jgi:hypothetical protein
MIRVSAFAILTALTLGAAATLPATANQTDSRDRGAERRLFRRPQRDARQST